MKVIALELGYDNVQLRQPGDEFELPDDVVFATAGRAWFEPVDEADKAKFAKASKKAAAAVPAIDPAKQAADAQK